MILFFMLISSVVKAQNPILTVKINGLENDKGRLMLEVLNAQKKAVKQLVLPIKKKQAVVEIADLGAGQYSVRVFHDANNNQKLDTNLVGIPKEAWGMSNNVKAILGPPDFKESLFWLKDDKAIEIVLR